MGIKDIVTREVFSLFTEGKFEEGRDILKNLSFRLDECVDTEEKRLILYNLNVVCAILEEYPQAKFYINMIKNIVEQDEEYIKTHSSEYLKILNNYAESFKNEIDIDSKKKIYERGFEISNAQGNIDQSLCYLSNICLLEEDYDGCVEILIDIHNYTNSNISKELCSNLKDIYANILKDLNRYSKEHYEEAVNLFNQSNACEMQG